MLPVPWHSAPCSHAIVVGDWLICTLMDWILLRIFFWWPARVTPILSKSLGRKAEGKKIEKREHFEAIDERISIILKMEWII